MKKLFLILILITALSACWSQESKQQLIKFWEFNISISKDFQEIDSETYKNKDFEIIYTYKGKRKDKDSSKSSIIIAKYVWNKPKDNEKFFNIVLDKFQREVAWNKILNREKVKKNSKIIQYFRYEVYDDVFKKNNKKDPSYYWLQAYIFWKNDIHTISFVSSKEEELKEFTSNVKNLKINK